MPQLLAPACPVDVCGFQIRTVDALQTDQEIQEILQVHICILKLGGMRELLTQH